MVSWYLEFKSTTLLLYPTYAKPENYDQPTLAV